MTFESWNKSGKIFKQIGAHALLHMTGEMKILANHQKGSMKILLAVFYTTVLSVFMDWHFLQNYASNYIFVCTAWEIN